MIFFFNCPLYSDIQGTNVKLVFDQSNKKNPARFWFCRFDDVLLRLIHSFWIQRIEQVARLGATESVDTISIQTPKGRLPLTLRYQHMGWKTFSSVDIASQIIKNFKINSCRGKLNIFGSTDLCNKAKLYSRWCFGLARCRVIRIPERSRRIVLA